MGLEYAVPAVPEDRVALIVNAGGPAAAMTIESDADLVCTGLPASVTVAVKFAVPVAVGVPEMSPVAGVRVRPAGRLPAVIDQA
jgi:hypothetical protein